MSAGSGALNDRARFLAAPIAAVALLSAAAAMATPEIYRWVDAAGVVHYGERPPTGVEARPVSIPPSPRQSDAVAAPTDAEPTVLKGGADSAQRAAEAEAAAEIERACGQARERVVTLEQARRVSRVADDGSRRFYTDAERAEALSEARRQVQEWCR